MKWVLATAHAFVAAAFLAMVLSDGGSLPAPWGGMFIIGLIGLSIFTVAWVVRSRID